MGAKSVILPADEMPRQWYNILADIKMNPPLGPDGQPVNPEDLAPVFPMKQSQAQYGCTASLLQQGLRLFVPGRLPAPWRDAPRRQGQQPAEPCPPGQTTNR